LVIRIIKEP